MNEKMKATVLYAPFDLRIEEVEKPKPESGEVLLKVRASGIRGTDVSIYAGKQKVTYPLIIGHEFAGQIAEVGEGVTRVKTGDRVVSDAVFSCGKCYLCQKGRR
ncbi:alcohol dehydrogenase catalytic domain-containing protein, partial [Candidatus Bathyarchaeota archaeon]|nr:alcohol dehydrogenase catalytic domain-containing protein [Candidatus Bathyarchaeota archaeon]